MSGTPENQPNPYAAPEAVVADASPGSIDREPEIRLADRDPSEVRRLNARAEAGVKAVSIVALLVGLQSLLLLKAASVASANGFVSLVLLAISVGFFWSASDLRHLRPAGRWAYSAATVATALFRVLSLAADGKPHLLLLSVVPLGGLYLLWRAEARPLFQPLYELLIVKRTMHVRVGAGRAIAMLVGLHVLMYAAAAVLYRALR